MIRNMITYISDLIYDMSFNMIYDMVTILNRMTMLILMILPLKHGMDMVMILNINMRMVRT